jgi:ribosomal protein S25
MSITKEEVEKYLKSYQAMTFDVMVDGLNIADEDLPMLIKILRELEKEGVIYMKNYRIIYLPGPLTKRKVKNYLYNNYDVTFEQIIEDLKIAKKDKFSLLSLKKILIELEQEGWIYGFGKDVENKEYSPGPSQCLE